MLSLGHGADERELGDPSVSYPLHPKGTWLHQVYLEFDLEPHSVLPHKIVQIMVLTSPQGQGLSHQAGSSSQGGHQGQYHAYQEFNCAPIPLHDLPVVPAHRVEGGQILVGEEEEISAVSLRFTGHAWGRLQEDPVHLAAEVDVAPGETLGTKHFGMVAPDTELFLKAKPLPYRTNAFSWSFGGHNQVPQGESMILFPLGARVTKVQGKTNVYVPWQPVEQHFVRFLLRPASQPASTWDIVPLPMSRSTLFKMGYITFNPTPADGLPYRIIDRPRVVEQMSLLEWLSQGGIEKQINGYAYVSAGVQEPMRPHEKPRVIMVPKPARL